MRRPNNTELENILIGVLALGAMVGLVLALAAFFEW